MFNSANMLRMGEDWESCVCHLVSHRIDIFYQSDGSSKLTRIITYFQTSELEKLIITFLQEKNEKMCTCYNRYI